jgi:hypothetical protein
MTTVITRFFDSAAQARLARHELIHRRRFSVKIIRLFEDANGLEDALTSAHVEAKTAKSYQKRMAKGGAVLLVFAGHKPLSVAKTTREVTAEMGAVDLGDLTEEVYVKEEPGPRLSVLRDHPHMLTRPRDPLSDNYHMADWPLPLISRRKPFSEALFPRHARMADFPIPLISRRKPYSESIFPRHKRMADFPIPLLSDRKPYDESIFPRHKRMADFPIPLISRRKPYTGSLIPRHQRMATWPFPLLINGKTGTNALIPGGPRMANFPIPLTSDRKPYTGSIIPRHGRMANFPIPLLSKRKPYAESMIEPHARMANFPIPLLSDFSFSKMLGLPTVTRR